MILALQVLIKFQVQSIYHISVVIRQSLFLPKQSKKYRSIFLDISRSLGLLRKGETHIKAKFHKTGLVICSNSRESLYVVIPERRKPRPIAK